MRLRIKVLLTTAAIMTLGYVIVTLAAVAQNMNSGRRESYEVVTRLFRHAVESGRMGKPGGPESLGGLIGASRLMAGWRIAEDAPPDGEGGPVLAEDRQDFGAGHVLDRVKAAAPGGKRYVLTGTCLPVRSAVWGYILELLPAMVVGMVMMTVALLLLLSRQVISPVAELADASRQLASGGNPVRPMGAGRRDEVGQLVRSFNRMADEVTSHRRELEQRVAEATDRFRRAQETAAIAQRLAATGKLAAGVAHEINNPLGGMVNAARRLEKCVPDGSRDREYLSLLQEGLDRIGRIVKKMTQFQRTTAELGPVDVRASLEGALRFAEHRLRGVELVRETAGDLPAVTGDRNGLEQVFLNLLINAADAVRDSDEKRVTVRARAAQGGARVVVEVEDTGSGMTAEERDAAFDVFHTTKPAGEGSGLGLPVAHAIVEGHGGELVLESDKGRGTRASVSLPASGGGKSK
ncbi:MAG: sensor histidine kinase [Planctomycetota bacterium]|jgi:signal transduction histidine kinase